MITKYSQFLILEKTDLNNLNLPQGFIKQIFKLNIKFNHNFTYKKINKIDTIEEYVKILNSDNQLLFKTINHNIIILYKLSKLVFGGVVYNGDFFRKIHINYNQITNYIQIESIKECYILEDFYQHETDNEIEIKRKNIKNLTDMFNYIYKDVFVKYYSDLEKDIKNIIKSIDKEKYNNYLEELHLDIFNISLMKKDILANLNIKNYILHNDISIDKILNYNDLFDILKRMKNKLFKINNNYLHISYYKDIDKKLELDPTIYKELRYRLNDPNILNKYKYLENASKFDLI